MPQPATSTDRLANVIQVIQLGRKTGTLTVERNSSDGLEQGTIYFVNGQMTQASAHQIEGRAAFNWLNTWGACRFTFTPSTSPATTVKLPAVEPDQIPDSKINGNPAQLRDTTPLSNTMARSGREDRTIDPGANWWQNAPGVDIPVQSRALEDALQRIEQVHFSRAHRHLYLLIDGHRSSGDLARLMGRSQGELNALLQDLERAGVIRR